MRLSSERLQRQLAVVPAAEAPLDMVKVWRELCEEGLVISAPAELLRDELDEEGGNDDEGERGGDALEERVRAVLAEHTPLVHLDVCTVVYNQRAVTA